MKAIWITCVAMIWSTGAFAVENYAQTAGVFDWIPLRPTTERHPEINPYKDIYVHKVEFQLQTNGQFQMRIQLPEDMSAGAKTVVTLTDKVSERTEGNYEFYGPNGSHLSCGVRESWVSAGCQVHYLTIPFTPAERQAFAEKKYLGTRKEKPLGQVAAMVGAEPYGRIRLSEAETILEGSTLGNGSWSFSYQSATGQWVNGKMSIEFDRGTYAPVGLQTVGLLQGLTYSDGVAEGGWSMSDEVYGWVRFRFNGNRFDGEWGTHDSTDPKGQWNGRRN